MRMKIEKGCRSLRASIAMSVIITISLLLTTCDLFKSGLGEKVDITAPVVTISAPQQNSYIKGTMTIQGAASDDLSLASLSVSYPGPTGQVTKSVSVDKGSWSFDIPTGTSGAENLPDGEQHIVVTAKDGSGKESQAELISYIDNLPPTVLVTVPQGYGSSRPTMSDYIDIKGEGWDRSPIVQVTVRLLSSTGVELDNKRADGTNTWSVRFLITSLADLQTYQYVVEVKDKAGNQNSYYYHSADIWSLLAAGTPFPATDEIGLLDQTRTGTAGSIVYADLYARRLGYPGGAFGDFNKTNDATLPILHFSNLDPNLPITSNVLGSKVPISGYVNPGPAGNQVNGSSVKAWILPWSATPSWPASPNVDAGAVVWNPISSSVSFQVEPKVSGAYIGSGRYIVKVEAGAVGTLSVTSLTCSFLVDSGAPRIEAVQPADLSLVTRKTFAAGTPLAGQTGIEIRAHLQDDNSAQLSAAVAALTSSGTALPGIAWDGAPGPDTWYVIQVPLGAGNSEIWFELEAKDDSNTINRKTVHYTIDETPPTVAIDSPSDGSWVTGNSTTVSGTSSDNTGQVRTIYVWVGLSSATPPSDITTWNSLTGNASWATTLPLSGEGAYTVRAVSVDFADNQSPAATRTFFLDQSNPTLDEISIGSLPVYRNAAFTLSGPASDTNALSRITITQKKNGVDSGTVLDAPLSGTSQTWSWILPSGSPDGTYEFTVTLTDIAGKTAPALSRTVIYDTVKPTIAVTSLTPMIGTNTVNGIVSLQAIVSEATGLDKVWYRYGDTGAFTEITSNKSTPTLSIDTTAFPDLALTNVWIRASDLAGNIETVSQPLAVDQASDRPAIVLTNMTAGAVDPRTNPLGRNPRVLGNVEDDDGVGTLHSIQIKIDADPYVDVSSPPVSVGTLVSWSHDIGTVIEGIHTLKIRARDKNSADDTVYGNPGNYSWREIADTKFFVDFGPPVLTITGPANGVIKTADFFIQGTAVDTFGMDTVKISIDQGPEVGVTSTSGDFTTWEYSYLVAGKNGVHSYQVKAIDDSGAETTQDRQFVVDTIPPTSSVNTPQNNQVTNGSLLVSGTASDNYQLSNIYYYIWDRVSVVPDYRGPDATWGTADDWTGWTALNQTYSWSFTLDTIAKGDGNYTLLVRPIDAGGTVQASATTKDFSVIQASDRPKIQVTSITEVGTAIQNLLPGDRVISGTIQDDDGVKASSIKVRILSSDGLTVLDDWANATSQPSSDGTFVIWSHAVSRSDGIYQIKVRAYDINSSSYSGWGYDDRFQVFVEDNGGVPDANDANGVVFAIDTANPTVTVTGPAQNFFTNGNEDKNANSVLDSGEDDNGNSSLDSAQSLPMRGTASDASGIASSQVKYRLQGGAFQDLATAGTVSWNAAIDTSSLAEGVYDWQILVSDNFNKTNTVDRIFTLDKTPPQVVISNPAASATVNGSMLIDGTATDKWKTNQDGFQVTSVRVWIEAGDPVTPPAVSSFYTKADSGNPNPDGTHWKELNGTNSWSYRFNTTGLNGVYTIAMAAVDNSGNVSAPVTRIVTFDQSTNLPVIGYTNMGTGYYTGTIDTANATSMTDDALSGKSVAAGWFVRFRTSTEIRKVTAFAGTTVTFTPPLSVAPSGIYDLFPNLVGAAGTIQGEITDDDGVDPATVQIAVDKNGDGDYLDTGEAFTSTGIVTNVVGSKVQFSYSLGSLAQGLAVYKFQVTASDIGEPAYGVAAVPNTTGDSYFSKDNAAPSAPLLTRFYNGFETKTTGLIGSNFNNTIDLRGTAADTVRVGLVEVKVGAAFVPAVNTAIDPAPPWSTWSFTDPAVGADEGEITVQVQVTDIFGKQTIESFVFNVDKTAPTVVYDNPGPGALVNGALLVTGTASDTYKVSSVYYWIEDAVTNPAPADATTWPTATGTTSWSFRFDSTSRLNGAKTLKIAARDNAGNLSAVSSRAVTFDQGLNQPVIRLTGLAAAYARGTANASTTVSMTDASLIGNADIQAGWVVTFPDGSTRTLSTFNNATGQLSWALALTPAFPAGSSFTIAAPSHTVGSQTVNTITDAGLIGASPGPAAGWSVLFTNGAAGVNGVTRLVTGFDSGTGTLTLTDVPVGVLNGTTTFRVVPKTLLGAGAVVSGTITDDDGVDNATAKIAMDLNNDGDYEDLQALTVSGSGTSVSFTYNLSALDEGTTVYKLKIEVKDIGEANPIILPVAETTQEVLFAKDNGAPANPLLEGFDNGYRTKTSNIENSFIKDQITLSGSASDGVGVSLVQVDVNGLGYQNATDTTSWSYSRGSLVLTNGTNVPVLVRVTDYWGRQTVASFTFKADTAAPTMNVSAFGRKLNGTETVQGTAGDLNSAVNAIYRWQGTTAVPAFNPQIPTANSWTAAGVTGTTTWSYSLDTIAVHNSATDLAYNLASTAVDEAGNYTTSTLNETINQDSDRPVLALTNINLTALATTNRLDANPKIIGTAQDDDGVSKTKILVSLDSAPYVLVTNPPAVNGTPGGIVTFSHELTDLTGTLDSSATTSLTDDALIGKTQVVAGSWVVTLADGSRRTVSAFNPTNGTATWVSAVTPAPVGSYTLSLMEGTHTVSLRVGDIGSPAYVEGSFDRAGTYRWEQSDGDATAGWQNDPTDFAFDTGAPVTALTSLTMADRYGGAYPPGRALNITSESAMPSTVVNNDWTLQGTVDDGNLASVVLQGDLGPGDVLNWVGNSFTATFDWLDGSGVARTTQGSHSITIRATDAFNKVTVKTLTVVFDSDPPTVTMASPSSMTVNGTVFMSGTFAEAATVAYAAGNGYDKQTASNAVAQVGWSYTFNSTILRNSAYGGDGTDSTYVSGDANTNNIEDGNEIWVYTSKVRLRASDAAGNVKEEIYTFTIDNNTDRPTTTIAQPADSAYRSGNVLVSGTGNDDTQADDGVAVVQVRVDVDGDGDFIDNPAFGADTHINGSVDSSTILSLTDDFLIGKPVVAGRWVVRFTGPPASSWLNETRVVASFTSGTGTIGWTANPDYYGSSILTAPAAGTTFVLEELYKNESTWIPVDALTNGVAWQVDINKFGELYASQTGHSGMIKVQARAVDKHKTEGAPSGVTTVFLDESVPILGSISVNAAIYTPGLATLSRGTVPITARYADDQSMNWPTDIKISFNSGTATSLQTGELYDWSAGSGKVLLMRLNNAAVSTGTSSATTSTSLTAASLSGRSDLVGKAIYIGSAGSRIIAAFNDGTDTVSWTGVLNGLSQAESFAVTDPYAVDTTTYYGGTSGTLSVLLRVTDRTNQATTATIELSVDNQIPTVAFNDPPVLTPVNGIYSFNGTAAEELGNPTGTYRYRVYGKAVDSGAVSGIASVRVFFVKDIAGTWYAYAPQGLVRSNQLISGKTYVILSAGTTNFMALGSTSNAAGWQFIANATGTGMGTGLVMAKDPPIAISDGLGGSEPTAVPTPKAVNAGSFTPGVRYRIQSLGSTSFTAIGAAANTVGAYFIATGAGSGDGTALLEYAIPIDKRTELGSNDDNENGDQDGFQESLRAKTGYDEWFADVNTRVFPDGPLNVHFVASDEAGNSVQDKVTGQIVNNPPSIGTLTFNGSPAPSDLKVKYGGTVTFVMNASDAGTGASIDAATYKLTVTNKYANNGGALGAEDGTFASFYYGVSTVGIWKRDFNPKTGGASGSATLTIYTIDPDGGGPLDNDGFVTDNWYRCLSEVKDADGNVAYKIFHLLVNNADNNRPVITQFYDFGQSSVDTGHIEDPGTVRFTAPATTVTDGTHITATALMNNAFIKPGWTVTDTTIIPNQTRTILAFTSATGQIQVTSAFSPLPSNGDSLTVKSPAELSGRVIITGKVYDDTDVANVIVEIDVGSGYGSLGTATLSNKTGDIVSGWTYDWSLPWDTATQGLTTVALNNVSLRAYGDDAVGPTAVGDRPIKAVDVVPYITSITDSTGLSTEVLRGATGKYSITSHATNTLTVNGYNLGSGSHAPAARISATAANLTTGVLTPAATYVLGTQITVSKNLTKSGYLTILVNGVPSVNNVNDNTYSRNIEKGADPRTEQWTDDRYVWAWGVTQVTVGTNLTYNYPDMIMSGDQPLFAFCDDNQGDTWRTTSDSAGTIRSGFRLQRQATIAYADGTYWIITGQDAGYGGTSQDIGYIELTGNGDGFAPTYGPGTGGYNWTTIEGEDYPTEPERWVNRFPFPKLIAETSPMGAGTSAATTDSNIYIAYYDAHGNVAYNGLKFISFKQAYQYVRTRGAAAPGTPVTGDKWMDTTTAAAPVLRKYDGASWVAIRTYGNADAGALLIRRIDNSAYDRWNGPGWTAGVTASEAERTGVNIRKARVDNAISPDVIAIPGTAGNSSKFFDMVKMGANGIAVVYYDAFNAKLKMAYSSNAFTTTTDTATDNLTNLGATWATMDIDALASAGQHVSAVTDGTKIYVTYYDYEDANLKFARISWNTGAPSVDGKVFIDKYLSAGSWTNIMLITSSTLTGQGNNQPFITYYADSYNGTKKPMRIAFPKFDAINGSLMHGTTGSGGVNDNYSGDWEVITVPATWKPYGGTDQFSHTQIGAYSSSTLPVVGWLGENNGSYDLEYAKLQPNN